MALKFPRDFSITNALLWKTALWLFVAAILSLCVTLWMSGTPETIAAMKGGRRLIIRISDGAIEGKTDAPALPEITEATPTAQATPTSQLENVPEPEKVTASETAQLSAAQALLESGVLKVATVPLAPVKDALRETLSVGTLPIIATDGTRPWRYYGKPLAMKGSGPVVAIVLVGLGLNKTITESALKLPENISLSLSPYAKDATTWATSARAVGHEILTDLPLQPGNYPASDPGPYGLMAGKPIEDNAARLQWIMSRTQGYIGLATPGGEAFSENIEHYRALLELISVRGLMLVLPHEPVQKQARKVLQESKLAYMVADTQIDEELTESAITTRLSTLEKLATKRGYAVGYAHAYPITIRQLEAWTKELESRGVTLVPLSYVTQMKFKK